MVFIVSVHEECVATMGHFVRPVLNIACVLVMFAYGILSTFAEEGKFVFIATDYN